MKVKIALWIALLGLAGAAHGQTTFTITGTATNTSSNASDFGYTSGQSYTFVFTTSATVPNNGHSDFSTSNTWVEYANSDAPIFTTVSGTGLTGSFTDQSDLITEVYAAGSLFQIALISQVEPSTTGLSTPGSTTSVGAFTAYLTLNQSGHPNFATPGSYTDLPTYFSAYAGDYLMTNAGALTKFTVSDPGSHNSVIFIATELVITSAIPEPSTYAALAGLASLGLVTWQRRRLLRPIASRQA